MSEKVAVIVNPASGRGRGAKMLESIRSAFADVGVKDVRATERKGDEARLCREAIEAGCTTVVACGGDGTWSNTANAIIEARTDCRLATIATGTGNDFAKSLSIPASDFRQMARLAVGGRDVTVDVGRIEQRHFLNVAGFGFDIAVLEAVEHISWLKGDALYLVAAIQQLFRYGGLDIEVNAEAPSRSPASLGMTGHLMLIIANARYFGGKFTIAPHADLGDGKLDGVAILDASPVRRMGLLGSVARGTHIGSPAVSFNQSSEFHLRFAVPPAYETDGEYRIASSSDIEVRCVPKALRVVTA